MTTGTTYSNFGHWKDIDHDGVIEKSEGDMKLAAAFVRNTKANVTMKLKLAPDITSSGAVEIRGLGDDEINFPIHTVQLGENRTYTYSGEAESAFRNTVYHYDDFSIRWQSRTIGGNWEDIGTSETDIYLLLDTPKRNVILYHTYVHIGSHYGADQTTEDGVILAVWEYFQTLKIKQQDEVYAIGKVDLPTAGRPIRYRTDYTDQINDGPMPFNGNCTCGGIALLFNSILHAEGLDQTGQEGLEEGHTVMVVTPDVVFLVKGWTPQSAQVLVDSELFDVVVFDAFGDVQKPYYKNTGYNIRSDSQLKDAIGLPGQNSPNPKADFSDHAWVRWSVNGVIRWFDPSYGVEYVGATDDDRLLSFQQTAIYGFTDFAATASDIELLLQLDLNRDGHITVDDELDPNPDDDIHLSTLYYWLVRRSSQSEVDARLKAGLKFAKIPD